MNNDTLIVFHRCGGKSLSYPPNTLLTIKWAIDYGAKAIEYDVVYCDDNNINKIIVVEPKLLKSAGLDINNLLWNDVKKINSGNKKFGDQKIPELDQVLKLVDKLNIHQQIHVKGKHPKTTKTLLDKLKGISNFSITSFDIQLLKVIKELQNSVKVGWIIKPKQEKGNEETEDLTALVSTNPNIFPPYSNDEINKIIKTGKANQISIIILCAPRVNEKTIIHTIKGQGFEVGAWGVGTNLDLARKLIQFNINRFTIDNPEQL